MSAKLRFASLSVLLPGATCIYALFTKQYAMALSCLISVACVIAFALFHRKFPFLTTTTYYSVIILILLSLYAGKALMAYSFIPYWDKILHFFSGFVFAAAGSQLYVKLNGDTDNKILIKLFTLSFAIAAAGVWEIYEFTTDQILGISSQNGSLNDTMWDMIAGTVSAVIMVVFKKI